MNRIAPVICLLSLLPGCRSGRSAVEPSAVVRSALRGLGDSGADDGALLKRLLALPAEPSLRLLGSVEIEYLTAKGERPKYHVHPQGLARDPETGSLCVSAVEIERERSPGKDGGKGNGYLFCFDSDLRPAVTTAFSRARERFHPGGMDFHDGVFLLPLAEYRPDSAATIYAVAADASTSRIALEIPHDHIGVAAFHRAARELWFFNWNSQTYYRYSRRGPLLGSSPNPSPDGLAYQDAQAVGDHHILFSGVLNPGATRFGLDLVDARSGKVVKSVRWDTAGRETSQGLSPFLNPTLAWLDDAGRLLVLAAPDSQVFPRAQNPSTKTRGDDIKEPHIRVGAFLLYEIR